MGEHVSVWSSRSVEETRALGARLAELASGDETILLEGEMGVGKTEFVKGLGIALGVDEWEIQSPTFALVHEHSCSEESGVRRLTHIDLYRLERSEELVDIDYHGTLESSGVSLVEWGDRLKEARPRDHLLVELTISGDTSRDLSCSATGERSGELLACWLGRCAEEDVSVVDADNLHAGSTRP